MSLSEWGCVLHFFYLFVNNVEYQEEAINHAVNMHGLDTVRQDSTNFDASHTPKGRRAAHRHAATPKERRLPYRTISIAFARKKYYNRKYYNKIYKEEGEDHDRLQSVEKSI